ncbi:MAG TPA: thioredoxin domain-containing protein [Gemmatimonadales bacterium]
MAEARRMKGFYLGLAAVAVIGVAAILWARSNAAGGVEEIGPIPVSTEAFPGYSMGSDSAPVQIIEYGDFQCPACGQFAVLTGPDVKRRLVETGQVRWTFRDFPLGIHPNALVAHLAAACADEQGQFWNMHDQLYFRLGEWAPERRPARMFRDYARVIGLDVKQFEDCVDSRRYLGRIEATRRTGETVGVSSTPTFIIGNLRVSGSLSFDSIQVLVNRVAGANR